jgi:hypothetical protein
MKVKGKISFKLGRSELALKVRAEVTFDQEGVSCMPTCRGCLYYLSQSKQCSVRCKTVDPTQERCDEFKFDVWSVE